MCRQIVGLRIGMGELLAFHTAVCEKAEMHNLSRESAAYRVIEDIRDYGKLGKMRKQINANIYDESNFNTPNNAIMALFKLQNHGRTENQILNACRLLGNSHSIASTNIQ